MFRCEMRQVDRFGAILYSSSQYIRVIVEPLPPPLPVISYAEKVSFSAVLALSIILLSTLKSVFKGYYAPPPLRSSSTQKRLVFLPS